MAESAFLLLAFARIGLSPDGGTTLMLPSRVGRQRAIELAMLAEPLPAATALDWGLVHDVAPDAELPARVDALAERLAAGPTRAYGVIKDLFNAQERPGLAEHLELEGNLIQTLAGTEDFREGVAAFTERRPADFRGR
jgi:enoyl-CoA hydratase/carnithine racemase